MHRPRVSGVRRSPALWLAGLAATAVLLYTVWVGQDPVPVDLGNDDPDARKVSASCSRFGRALPEERGSLERRPTVAGTPPGWAAYGDPMVIVRCGVPVYTRYKAGDELIVINDVAWDIDERAGGVVGALPRSLVNVEVYIPRKYKAELLSLLSEAVKQAQPL